MSTASRRRALTLVEEEVVADVGLAHGATRPQLTGRGVRLKRARGETLPGRRGECHGVELCEPCLHLQQLTRPSLIRDLVHRGGINADILSDGTISIGGEVSAQ